MAEQQITTKPFVDELLEEDSLFINHDGALRQVKREDADIASAADLVALENQVDEKIYDSYIQKTASGAIASFSDGADDIPVKSLKIGIEPKQAGSGTPSPSNVRAITGWTGANVYRGGHNYAEDLESGSIDSTGAEAVDSNAKRTPFIPVTEGMKVLCEWKNADAGYRYSRIALYNSSKAFVSFAYNSVIGAGQTHSETVTIPSGVAYLRFCSFNCPPQIIYKVIPQITTYPISFSSAGTVYGGEVDVTSGVLTKAKNTDDMKSLTWQFVSAGRVRANLTATPEAIIAQNIGEFLNSIYTPSRNLDNTDNGFYIGSNGVITVRDDTHATSLASFTSFITSVSDAKVVYPLATPTTYQLTPTEVRTLLGENNVWADTGNIEVLYRADPSLAYRETIPPSLAALIAPTEVAYKATRNYTTGSLLIVNNVLYKATANIANGGTITVGTNVTPTTLAEVISAL